MKNHFLSYASLMGLSLLALISFWSFRSIQPSEESEFMTIVVREDADSRSLIAHISINGKSFLQEELAINTYAHQGDYDFNPIIKLIIEYQRGGWKIVSSSMDTEKVNADKNEVLCYFFLERKKPQTQKK